MILDEHPKANAGNLAAHAKSVLPVIPFIDRRKICI
jgi:hypothetical protein